MKPIWRLSVVGAVTVCMLLLVGVGAALAVELTNTSISLASFFSGACGPVVASLTAQPWSFNGGVDGFTNSVVVAGCAAGGSAGLNFYIYDVVHNINSSEQMIHGISLDWAGLVAFDFAGSPPGAETSYWIQNTGNKAPSSAMMNPSTAEGTLTFLFAHETGNHILPGEESHIFGAVSPLPPGTTFANLLNAGQETSAQVLTPVPEPASMLLLSSGLLGLAGLKGRRRKVKIPAVA